MTNNKSKYPRGWYSKIAKKLNMDRGTVRRQLMTDTESPAVAKVLEGMLRQKTKLDSQKENYKQL